MLRKKVCILKHRLNQSGGLEKSTYAIAHGFVSKGCSVVILTSDKPDLTSIHIKHITFHRLHLKSSLGFFRIREFDKKAQKYLENHHFDIVFGMDRNKRQSHLRLGNGIHKVFLQRRLPIESWLKRLSFYINPLHRLLLQFEKQALENSSLKCLFTNSAMVKQELLNHYKTAASLIYVVHNGVEWQAMDKDFHSWIEKKPKIANELGLNPLEFHFLFIGHGFKRKGLELLLQALSHLTQEQFHLSVIGKEKNYRYFRQLTHDLNLEDKVTFFQERSDVRKFYQLADALIVPSLYDPFANVTVEALAMGLFVLTSRYNGGKEVLQDFSGKVLDDIFDPKKFADVIKETIASNKKTWAKSIKIRESVKHLDFSLQTATLVDISLNHCNHA